jgi:hypothetical protein
MNSLLYLANRWLKDVNHLLILTHYLCSLESSAALTTVSATLPSLCCLIAALTTHSKLPQ